ncbi:hypothetical protein BpHYR1_021995 [Brachionus plicatilis]|uniref:Uncharacterized protein n=1 Tax=Brachionus plicatilis TaxID=10195 RepID=A0A3M7RF03_BRAPC|nr:hypothetical protein BpHYR1_021995 [Brachionus plicatilis]
MPKHKYINSVICNFILNKRFSSRILMFSNYILSLLILPIDLSGLKSKSDFDFEIILDSSQSQTLTFTDSDFKV